MARSFALSCLLLVCLTASSTFASGDYIPIGKPITLNATATLHGNGVGGACGYGNATHKNIVALGPELFQTGLGCGQCYLISCVPGNNSKTFCKSDSSVMVQSVDICRECPKYDFALSPSAFDQIVNETYQTGTLDIEIQQVKCPVKGDIVIRTDAGSTPYYFAIFIQNVGGIGSVKFVEAKTGGGKWTSMTHVWGVNWVLNGHVTDSVSLRLTGGDGTQVTLDDCVPADWTPGSSYPCSGQLS